MESTLAKEIIQATITGVVDKTQDSREGLRPRLLYNDVSKANTVLANISKELEECETFWFSVAFITKSGLITLKESFKNIYDKGIKGRILTTDYLSFNQPNALRELLKFTNLEVRVFTEEHFHTKGYMFKKGDLHTLIVGSSNLTQNALKANKEWNLKINSLNEGELIEQTNAEFELMWNRANSLTEKWIQQYEKVYLKNKSNWDNIKVRRLKSYKLDPNYMQKEAIKSLVKLRDEGKDKALLISATGTGKTYLSAFDVRNFKPKKMLFLAHREQILKQAEDSFKNVLGEQIKTGFLTGNFKDIEADYLFSTTNMMSKKEVRERFEANYFDYIIIDETHKAGARSYLDIIDYYKPKFLLGMTATPERTDGFDIYKIFDHNIAYEIRLQQAMEEDLLCPFHYFGVTELTVNGEVIDDSDFEKVFSHLISEERVKNIIEKIEFYGYSGNRVKGLIFCRDIREAKELSNIFNKKGYRTLALAGSESTQEDRENAIKRLEKDSGSDCLDYIFTVDIFNEGVDIPEVNQVVMLRPTQSSIVFVQQLGRGLRKSEEKEYVVVIDFIGNYTKNFLIPIALSGDRTFNKDTLRKYIAEGNRIIPGCSTINFDRIAQKRIYESINSASFSKLKLLKEEYEKLKYKLGRIPTLIDFYKNGAIDPVLILSYSKSYYNFLKKVESEYTYTMSEKEARFLECISLNLANGKRPHELLALKRLIKYDEISKNELKSELINKYGIKHNNKSIDAAINLLRGEFWNSPSDKKNYVSCNFIEQDNISKYVRCASYSSLLKKKHFYNQIQQIIELGLIKYEDNYTQNYKDTDLVLYKKYTRKDVCRLMNWEKDESSVMYGYKIKYDMCPIFVKYKKPENIDAGLKYDDKFISKDIFSWMTRPDVTLKNKDVCKIKDYKNNGLNIELFIIKSDDEGSDFYYMGRVKPLKFSETTTIHKGIEKPIVNIIYKMDKPVRDDIYEYLLDK